MISKNNRAPRTILAAATALLIPAGFLVVPTATAVDAGAFNAKIIETDATGFAALDSIDVENPGGSHRFVVKNQQATNEELQKLDDEGRIEQRAKIAKAAADDANAALADSGEGEFVPFSATAPGLGFENVFLVETDRDLTESEIEAFLKALAAQPGVRSVEQDGWIAPNAVQNDEKYPVQWNLHQADLPQITGNYSSNQDRAWDMGFTGKDKVIAILDTGITDHPDLAKNRLRGFDMMSDPKLARDNDGRDDDPTDEGMYRDAGECGYAAKESTWHGTHVAGIAAAEANNGIGIAGAAPDAQFLPIRIMSGCGGSPADLAAGIVWSAGGHVDGLEDNKNKADVINMSLGTQSRCRDTTPYPEAIATARELGAVLVAAAGNNNDGADWTAPGNCAGLITVGATGPTGERAFYSNYGPEVDISAPGGDSWPDSIENLSSGVDDFQIWSTVNTGLRGPESPSYGVQQGTSMATPLVSAAIALGLEAKPDATQDEIIAALKKTANKVVNPDSAKPIGAGILNTPAFIEELTGGAVEVPTTTEPSTPVTTSPADDGDNGVTTTVTATSTAKVTATVTSTYKKPTTVTNISEPTTLTTTVEPEPTTKEVTATTTKRVTETEPNVTSTVTLPRETVTLEPTETSIVTSTQAGTTVKETATTVVDSTVEPAPVTSTVTEEPGVTTVTPKPVTVVPTTTVVADQETSTVYSTQPVADETVTEEVTETTTATSTVVVDEEENTVPVVTVTKPAPADEWKIEWGGMRDNLGSSQAGGILKFFGAFVGLGSLFSLIALIAGQFIPGAAPQSSGSSFGFLTPLIQWVRDRF